MAALPESPGTFLLRRRSHQVVRRSTWGQEGPEAGTPEDAVFVFIGEGRERKELEQYVFENKILNTYFLGLKRLETS